jgi:hypothetical protein
MELLKKRTTLRLLGTCWGHVKILIAVELMKGPIPKYKKIHQRGPKKHWPWFLNLNWPYVIFAWALINQFEHGMLKFLHFHNLKWSVYYQFHHPKGHFKLWPSVERTKDFNNFDWCKAKVSPLDFHSKSQQTTASKMPTW